MSSIETSVERRSNGNGRGVDLVATDVTRQRRVRLSGYPRDATVGELVSELVDQMSLTRTNAAGGPVLYHARLARESRHLHASEVVGDTIESGDEIALHPNVDAGAGTAESAGK